MATADDRNRVLHIRAAKDSNAVLIQVEDSGTGVAPENVEHIFDPFFTTKIEGLGMGLSISRSVIEAHGGRLWVSAGTTAGAVFQFRLPIANGDR